MHAAQAAAGDRRRRVAAAHAQVLSVLTYPGMDSLMAIKSAQHMLKDVLTYSPLKDFFLACRMVCMVQDVVTPMKTGSPYGEPELRLGAMLVPHTPSAEALRS